MASKYLNFTEANQLRYGFGAVSSTAVLQSSPKTRSGELVNSPNPCSRFYVLGVQVELPWEGKTAEIKFSTCVQEGFQMPPIYFILCHFPKMPCGANLLYSYDIFCREKWHFCAINMEFILFQIRPALQLFLFTVSNSLFYCSNTS